MLEETLGLDRVARVQLLVDVTELRAGKLSFELAPYASVNIRFTPISSPSCGE